MRKNQGLQTFNSLRDLKLDSSSASSKLASLTLGQLRDEANQFKNKAMEEQKQKDQENLFHSLLSTEATACNFRSRSPAIWPAG